MLSAPEFKEQFIETSAKQWTMFQEPDVWLNQPEELTIRAVEPFEESNLHQLDSKDLGDIFGRVNRRLARIRIEMRGVPYHETEIIEVGDADERRYIHPSALSHEGSMSEFQDHVAKVMTESTGIYDFDSVIDNLKEHSNG